MIKPKNYLKFSSNKIQKVLFIILLLGVEILAVAKDFGKWAHSFSIKEEGFITMIKRKLETIDFEKENKKMAQIAREKIENPTPVKGIHPCTKTREFLHDPSYILLEDVILPCGKVLYAAGSRVNPLDHMDLERRLFFIDAKDQEQSEWLEEFIKPRSENDSNNHTDMIILVGGSVFKTQEKFGRVVYFDQSGELTTKFGIKASPALVEQEGKMLKIKEFNLKDKE